MLSSWDGRLERLKRMVLKPIVFNDVKITVNDVAIGYHCANWKMEDHRHLWYEMSYLSSGEEYIKINQKEFLVKAGQWYVVPAGYVHSHHSDTGKPSDGFCVRFVLEKIEPNESLDDVFLTMERLAARFSVTEAIDCPISGESFIESLENESDAMIQVKMIELFLRLVEQVKPLDFEQKTTEVDEDGNKRLVHQAMIYMKKFYKEPFSAQDIAESLHVSYRHLSRVFKEATGLTIIQARNEIKVNYAKKLLRETNMPLKSIADEVGYENESYLSKIFLKYACVLPSDYRKQYKMEVISSLLFDD